MAGDARLPVADLNEVNELDLFLTEPREFTRHRTHVYAASRALAAERVLARAAQRYLCLAEAANEVRVLGDTAVPVEVIPMARSYVSRELAKFGGAPRWEERAVSDAGNDVIKVDNLDLTDPYTLEDRLGSIPGVVGHGLVARHPADIVLVRDGNRVCKFERA